MADDYTRTKAALDAQERQKFADEHNRLRELDVAARELVLAIDHQLAQAPGSPLIVHVQSWVTWKRLRAALGIREPTAQTTKPAAS